MTAETKRIRRLARLLLYRLQADCLDEPHVDVMLTVRRYADRISGLANGEVVRARKRKT